MEITKNSKKNLIYKGIFILTGTIILCLGIKFAISTISFVNKGVKTEATVINLKEQKYTSSNDYTTQITYVPIYSYETKDGKQYIKQSSSASNPPIYNVGEKIKIIYNADTPQDSRIDSFLDIYLPIIILFIMTIVFLGIGIFIPTTQGQSYEYEVIPVGSFDPVILVFGMFELVIVVYLSYYFKNSTNIIKDMLNLTIIILIFLALVFLYVIIYMIKAMFNKEK